MKNKSKLKKVRQKQAGITPGVSKEWLYLPEEARKLREIYEVFEEDAEIRAEIWEEAGVVELMPADGKSMDIERTEEPDVFWVTIVPESFAEAEKMMKKIVAALGGSFCEDNAAGNS